MTEPAADAPPLHGAARARQLGDLFRVRTAHGHHRVTYVELFFDLVFVFAITQISHTLLGDFTTAGVLRAEFILLAVWAVWISTSWITNWLDPERTPIRLLLFALMIAGIGQSMSIPDAFGAGGLAFAICYSGAQIGRTLFMLYASRRADLGLRRNFQRVLAWLVFSGAFWIAGGASSGGARVGLFCAALGLDFVGPLVRFRTPGLGASEIDDWSIEGGHLAERCAPFVIIALGESVLVTGASFAKATPTPVSIGAFAAAFTGAIAMWWIYFDRGADHASERIRQSANPGRLARIAFSYLHLPIVGGIVLTAVANELVLATPTGVVGTEAVIAILGGPLLYLLGVLLFKHAIRDMLQFSHLLGLTLFGALVPFSTMLSPLLLAAASTSILLLVAAWEAISVRRGPLRSRKERRAAAEEARLRATDRAASGADSA